MYTDKLDNIVNKYNSTYHITIKMKPVDGKPSMYIDFGLESNYENAKLNFGDQEYQNMKKRLWSKLQ